MMSRLDQTLYNCALPRVMIAAFVAGLFLTGTARAQWPQRGGPNQDFTTTDASGLADSWPEQGPKRIWTRELGVGYSGIIVDAGRLYTMARDGDNESVVCIDAGSGKTIWEQSYSAKPHEKHQMQFTAGPRATPLLADGRLYTIGVAGHMNCLDPNTGKIHWSHNLWTEFDATILQHGYSSSPIAYKDMVIVLVGGEGHSIVAFKTSDGSLAWKDHDYDNGYSTPKIINVDGEDQLVTFMQGNIVGLDPNNGALKWSVEQKGANVSMPVWGDDNTLFYSSLQAGAKGIKLTRNGDKTKVEEIWKSRKVQLYHVNTVAVGDWVYGTTGSRAPHFLAAINRKTGKLAWRERGFGKTNIVYGDGKMILLDESGELTLASVSPEGFHIHSQVQMLESVAWTVPTLVGKTLYLRDKKTIMALDLGSPGT